VDGGDGRGGTNIYMHVCEHVNSGETLHGKHLKQKPKRCKRDGRETRKREMEDRLKRERLNRDMTKENER